MAYFSSSAQWGDMVGATREAVNQQMGAWKRQGVIRTERGFVTILRIDELQGLADCALG